MKKILCVLLVVLSLFILGCSTDVEVENVQEEVQEEPEMAEQEVIHVDEQFEATATDETGALRAEVSIDIEADLAVTTDCEDPRCFEDKFAACEDATFSFALSPSLEYQYAIVGPESNGCSVTTQFLANPNPEWVGEEMTCVYDNSKDFMTSVQEVINSFNSQQRLGDCSGPLYALMTGQ